MCWGHSTLHWIWTLLYLISSICVFPGIKDFCFFAKVDVLILLGSLSVDQWREELKFCVAIVMSPLAFSGLCLSASRTRISATATTAWCQTISFCNYTCNLCSLIAKELISIIWKFTRLLEIIPMAHVFRELWSCCLALWLARLKTNINRPSHWLLCLLATLVFNSVSWTLTC